MKRFLFLLIVMAISITSYAQIQQKILGYTLGVSTKSSVLTSLKSKGVKVEFERSGSLGVTNIKFSGIVWDYASFDFFKDKLYSVYFHNRSSRTPSSTISNQYDLLKTNLQKYNNYRFEGMCVDNNIWFYDGKTYIDFDKNWKNGELWLILNYIDVHLYELKNQYDSDEL